MAFNVAIWYTKFASRLAGKEKYVLLLYVWLRYCLCCRAASFFIVMFSSFNSVTEAEAKDVHRSLKVAAGIFKNLKVRHVYSPALVLIYA